MQASSVTGTANVNAPCSAEGFRLYSATTFTFQFVTRANEVDPASGVKRGPP